MTSKKQNYSEEQDETVELDISELEARRTVSSISAASDTFNGTGMWKIVNFVADGCRRWASTFTGDESDTIDFNVSGSFTETDLDFPAPDEEEQEVPRDKLEHCFEIRKEIAQGGQAKIRIAHDRKIHRTVAVKSLHDKLKNKKDRRRAFLAEARVTAQLDHPAIAPVYALCEDDEHGLHLAMKLIRGKTLKEYLEQTTDRYHHFTRSQIVRSERTMLWQRLEIFQRICEAISYAHHRNVIHRDVKPANIMIGSFNETYVMDWGIAEYRKSDGTAVSGFPDKMAGTPQYIAPEILNKKPYDHRADIFLLGLTLYEMVFLKQAYSPSKNKEEATLKARSCCIEPFEHRFGIHVDMDLRLIIAKALSPDPEKRYQTVKELTDDLRSYEHGDATEANPDNFLEKILRKLRHHYKLIFSVSLLLSFLAACAVVFVLYKEVQRQELQERTDRALSTIYSTGLRSCAHFDRLFIAYEGLLSSISREATLLLEGEPQQTEYRFYTLTDGLSPATAPPGFRYAPSYRKPIALSTMVYIVPGGKITPEIERKMKLLYPLQRSLAAALHRSLEAVYPAKIWPEELEGLIRNTNKPPLLVAYFGAADGLHVGYPYEVDYHEGYDPRERTWYKDALAHQEGAYWGLPYVDTGEVKDIVLTCSRVSVGRDGKVLGVAAADISLGRLLDLLEATGNSGDFIENKLLIDRHGRIIADSKIPLSSLRQEDSLSFGTVPDSQLFQSLWEKGNGWVFNTEDDTRYLYFFFKIESLNWLYVERIDFEKLLEKH